MTASMPPHHRLHVAARTDPGLIRANNEDSFFAGTRMLVVADGMGGHAAGEVASRLVVDAFAPLDTPDPSPDLSVDLVEATRRGNAAIADMVAQHPAFDGMGTTVTAILFDGRRAALAHVGDSRAYLYRSGVLHQLTHDDTFVQSLVDEGRITEAQAHDHPQRNLVLRALTGTEIDPSIAIRESRRGDRYLICSDGLCGVVGAESIADALAGPDPDVAADALIQLALDAGAPDNVTVIIADVVEIDDVATVPAIPVAAAALSDDPSSTNPIQRLTREMPRVPLPPIPEEPGGAAEIIVGAGDVGDYEGGDDAEDEDADSWDDDADLDSGSESDTDTPTEPDTATGHRDRDDGSASGGVSGDDVVRGDSRPGDSPSAAGAVAAGTATRDDTARASAARLRDRWRSNRSGDRTGKTHPPVRRRRYRRSAIIVTAAILLVAGITGSTIWVRHQYFVSDQGNLVVVFRGVDGSLLGWHFSTFQETSCADNTNCAPMKVSDLQPATQNQVRLGIKATSLADARDVVQRLSGQLLPPCPKADTDNDGASGDAAPTSTPETTVTRPAETPTAPTTPPAAAITSPASEPTAAAAGILAQTLAAVRAPAATGAPSDPSAREARAREAAAAGPERNAPAQPEDNVMSVDAAPGGSRAAAADASGTSHPASRPDASADAAAASSDDAATATIEFAPSAVTVTETVTATPLAPAPAVPGVTCRNVP